MRRLSLFFKGDKSGVAVWWLARVMPFYSELLNIPIRGYVTNLEDLRKSELVTREIVDGLQIINSPNIWNAGSNLATFLFDYVQKFEGKVIFETGVANGVTTKAIQHAIGDRPIAFHSVDTNPLCFKVNDNSKNWTFHHLEGRNLKNELRKIASNVPRVDLWIHDSDHHYVWQSFEYKLALDKLNPGGLLVSDDVDFSKAWAEMAQSNELEYVCAVFDGRKCFGIAQKLIN
jgi:hypothetical protein